VCSLLETCGQFFNKGLAKKRLDRFLAFYQRYLLAKPPLPLDVEFDVQVCPHRPTCSRHSQSCFDSSIRSLVFTEDGDSSKYNKGAKRQSLCAFSLCCLHQSSGLMLHAHVH